MTIFNDMKKFEELINEIKKIEMEKYKFVINGNKTIMIKDNKKIIVECDKEDEFDIEKGIMLCLLKDNDFSYSDLKYFVENAVVVNKNKGVKNGKRIF